MRVADRHRVMMCWSELVPDDDRRCSSRRLKYGNMYVLSVIIRRVRRDRPFRKYRKCCHCHCGFCCCCCGCCYGGFRHRIIDIIIPIHRDSPIRRILLPLLSISWEYYPHVKILLLDDYETYRPNRRSTHEMILSRELRDAMLRRDWDVSRAEIAAAIRDTIKIKNQRRQTVQNLNKDKVEELFEGASKKIFRSLMFKSSTTQELDLLNQKYNAVQELRQQELKLSRQEQQQPFGNDGNNSTIGIKDSFVVVGLNIEDTEMNEDLDDNDDDELKEVFVVQGTPETQPASVDQPMKKPILIVEDDDDAAMLMNVESMKNNGGTGGSRNTIVALTPDREQYKGETSSQDGSIHNNLNRSRHRVTNDIVPCTERVQVDTSTEI